MKKTLLIILCLLLVFTFASCGGTSDENAVPSGAEDGAENQAVEGDVFTFETETIGDEPFTSEDLKDAKLVIVNLWEPWCGPCVGEMPAFEKLKNDRMSGVEIVAVNYQESKADVDAFIKENGFTFDIAYDEKGEICDLYPTNGIPYTLIIKNGIIEKTFVGAPADAYNTYKAAIEECLK